jgi:2-C-methyl-D-erythritol 4-phosphate cytidylyltransferase / 2-C-methyl-D-erythritol 2,4-cyclodiphosphate synthase
MTTAAIVLAAGRGLRAGAGTPKQYRLLAGRSLLAHTLAAFARHPGVSAVQAVIHEADRAHYEQAAAGLKLRPPVLGGATRQESVRLGLEALAGDAPRNVLIHDGARPLVSAGTIGRCIAVLEAKPGVIAALPVVDALKRAEGGRVIGALDRDGLWRAQTPQGFHYAAIRAAHKAQAGGDAADDAAVAMAAGIDVTVVAGDEDNLKVTREEDFASAERLLASRAGETRVGSGFDTHAFAAGKQRPLWLCGVQLAGERGLEGHSDADVGLHALTDAILGALAEGDIGQHFPPSDARWRNAASEIFLRHAAALVAARGGAIAHVDVTLICEAPRIAPHRQVMRERIAALLGLELDRVSVKATTTEKLGFLGRGEGIAAQATATVRLPAGRAA